MRREYANGYANGMQMTGVCNFENGFTKQLLQF